MRTMTSPELRMAHEHSYHQRIFIVEDDEDIRTLLGSLLEDEGLEVVGEASDGLEAISQVLERRPDVAIVDYYLPHMDGERTARVLRSLMPNVHIVAFSGSLSGKPYWADSYVTKSRMFDLPAAIRSVVEKSTDARVAGEPGSREASDARMRLSGDERGRRDASAK